MWTRWTSRYRSAPCGTWSPAVHEAGARALGYAAVYAVGTAEWPRWSHAALLTPTGAPYGLGDFLNLVDPAEPGWLAHFAADLAAGGRAASASTASTSTSTATRSTPCAPTVPAVAVEESFATVIAAARASLPGARLVFNNVNNFPTWRHRPDRPGRRLHRALGAAHHARPPGDRGPRRPRRRARQADRHRGVPTRLRQRRRGRGRPGDRVHHGDPVLARRDPAALRRGGPDPRRPVLRPQPSGRGVHRGHAAAAGTTSSSSTPNCSTMRGWWR